MSRSRYRGALLGLACGDAVGAPVEFYQPASFPPLTDMIGGGHHRIKPGQWTDDTSMALCLAESLIKCRQFDAHDQMLRYLRWYMQGHLSSSGRCFGLGGTIHDSLKRFQTTGNPYSGSDGEFTQANGSIMRLAPVPMFFAGDPVQAVERSGESSRTTHGATSCIDACRYLGALITGALRGDAKDVLLSDHFGPCDSYWVNHPLCEKIDQIAAGSFKDREPPEIKGTGYVVESLEAALWAFYKSTCFKDGCLLAVNLGDDADTTGAIYGQLAGAFYGEADIPEPWRERLFFRTMIESFADQLYELSALTGSPSRACSGDSASPD